MLTIEHALSLYTDEILAGNDDCMQFFAEQLNQNDVTEFLELANIVRAIEAHKQSMEFEKLFKKLDQHKQEVYDSKSVVDFRGQGDKEVSDQIDCLFSEEFDDE